jgi:Bacterial PH domain
MDFNASLDKLSKVVTVAVFVVFVVIGQHIVREMISANGDVEKPFIHVGVLLLFVVTILGSYLFSTNRYTLNDTQLVINRPIGNKIINLTSITEIRAVDSSELAGTIRTFGNGGLFGYYGKFYNKKFGTTTWYATQRINRILILTKEGDKIVISPDDMSLLDKIQSARQIKV